ncbi:hypothetical protein [Rhodococcus daqingensis]|uniref:Uncharacterized protein n=1 Tax=Rhodococcus daqingensis TaxID=2479363 RepID=A0ABW2RXU0_9NOCA
MGSLEIMEWLHEGVLAGDPIRGALFTAAFFIVGLGGLIIGRPLF